MKKFTDYIEGQTPIDPNEVEGLIPDHITQLSELNELEQANITKALQKYLSGHRKKWNLSDPSVLKQIHKDMFDETWNWAGQYRKSMKNIGVFPEKISEEIKKACDDFTYWVEKKTFSPTEIAVRFHYRLVSVHPFPNGNGRFARIVGDIFLKSCELPALPWGGESLTSLGKARKNYLNALKEADLGNVSALLKTALTK